MDHKTQDNGAKKITVEAGHPDTSSDKLRITHRPFVTHDKEVDDTPSEISNKPDSKPAPFAHVSHNVIKPLSDFKVDPAPNNDKAPKYMDTKPPVKKSVEAEPPKEDQSNTTNQNDTQNTAIAEPAPAPRKEYEAPVVNDEKREHEIEEIIDSRQYFVPIDAVAHKRSVNVSIILTILIFLLALILVDLMLDSGTILLLQKVPHTHFFSTRNTP